MKRILTVLVLLLLLAAGGVALVLPGMQKRLLQPPETWPGDAYVLFGVEKGASGGSVARDLESKGLIRSARAFRALLRRREWQTALKPGLYKLEAGSSAEDIARQIVDHETFRIKVTIPEGLTVAQTGQRIEKAGKVDGKQWLPTAAEIKAAATPALVKRVTGLDLPTPTVEGYLFPATYWFEADATAADVVSRLLSEFSDRFAGRYTDEIGRNGRSLHEIVTLASIVEREAAVDPERPLVAQVFLNRLAIGMKLESCATVQYALPEHKERLLYADLAIKSPYNTYMHKGLPPGPICSPGMASLMAALRPQATDALYFVSKGDGTHTFSRSFGEHQNAIDTIRGR